MFRRLIAVFAAWTTLTGAAHAACQLHLIADFKVTLQGSSPLIDAKINGENVKMIADSGAFYSSLSQGAVTQFKLQQEAGNVFMYTIGIGGTQSISTTKVKSFTIADQTLSNQVFLVTDNEVGAGVAGLMGENILGLVDAYYDLPDGAIKMLRPVGCGDRPFVLWDASRPFSTIPLAPHEGSFRAIQVDAFVNGKRIRAELDTGASASMLSADAARRAGLNIDDPTATNGGVHRGIGRRMVATSIVPVESFKIGDEEVKHTRLRVASFSLPGVDMLLGEDFFLSHRVYVANSQRQIYVTYTGGPVFDLSVAPRSPATQTALSPPKLDGPAPDVKRNDGSFAPTDADGFSRRGMAYASRRQFALAIADLTRSTELAPKEARYLTERATVYWASGQPQLAKPDLDKSLQLDPGDTQALVTRAALRIGSGDKPGGLADLGAADKALPKEADIRFEMAGLYSGADSGAGAVAQLSLWIKAHPDDNRLAETLNARCWDRALFDIDAEQAVADCDAALRHNHKMAAYLDSRGLAHLRLGQNDQAIEDYDAALALEPRIAWSLYGRGLAKLRKAQTADGKADLAAATALAPRLPDYAKAHGFSP